MSRQEQNYYVYLVASCSHVLYCGITSNLRRRMDEHREETFDGFSALYKRKRLVWFERFKYFNTAIAREKQIRRWRREKKLWLINQTNPAWLDLSETWRATAGPSTTLRSGPTAGRGRRDDKSGGQGRGY